jgi:hypothetical protein
MLSAFSFRHGFLLLALMLSPLAAEEPMALFNGTTLNGWDGDPRFWKVQDGTITGQTTAEVPTGNNTFLVWTLGEVDDFELTAEYKIDPGP